ncbi:MAG: RNA methyltransferase [Bacteroidales bacterium]|nr:RNA methyltransferase [Bacteroidales bacterium]
MKKLLMSEMGRLSIEQFKSVKKNPLVVVLDNVRSHHNVGAVFRTCDAFACERLLLCGITGTPPHRDIQKTALGATESVEWRYYENTIDAIVELKSFGYKIVALEIAEGSIPVDSFVAVDGEKYALVLGNEVDGVEDAVMELADICLEIPQFGTKHSLNVSVSGGIAIWEICKKVLHAVSR